MKSLAHAVMLAVEMAMFFAVLALLHQAGIIAW
jgi:hypothetical protein